MTAKIYEYMGSERPVFALAPEGPLKKLILDGRFGYVVSPNDVNDVATGFAHVYDQWSRDKTLPYNADLSVRKQFSRLHISEQMAGVVANLCNRDGTDVE
jgi:hypothetical protein